MKLLLNTRSVNAEFDEFHGDLTAKNIYAIIFLDPEDLDDTLVEIWCANDKKTLKEMFMTEQCSSTSAEENMLLRKHIEESWGVNILVQKIARQKK